MDFWSAFMKVLPHHPVRSLGALYWRLTRRRVRALNRLRCIEEESPRSYERWIHEAEGLDFAVLLSSGQDLGLPKVSVLLYLDAAASSEAHRRSVQSVIGQRYGEWELLLIPAEDISPPDLPPDPRIRVVDAAPDAAAALEAGVDLAQGQLVLPLRAGDVLAGSALWHFAVEAHEHPDCEVLYGDEDELDPYGRRTRPYFKPEWNREQFLAQDYLSGSCAIRTPAARAVLPLPQRLEEVAVYTLLLRLAASGHAFHHVPHVVCHSDRSRPRGTQEMRRQAVEHYLERIGSDATAHAARFGTVRVSWPLPRDPPLVTVIIPTRDKVRLLSACLRGVLQRTRYPNFEVLVVDNGSTKTRTHRYLREIEHDPRVRVLRYPGAYNYSAINNFAARQARGDYVCLLNNDTEVVREDWLCEMMRQAVRPHVGAVGAKLLYPDGRVQHAGVIVGIADAAGHAHRFLRNDEPGYFNHAHLPQYVSAVTAACLVVEKRKLLEVGALDEKDFAVAFNDVDLCLKLNAAGWRNVYTPHAVLIHHESKSRRKDYAPSERRRYQSELRTLQQRWGTERFVDPCHHPNLSRMSETFRIRAS